MRPAPGAAHACRRLYPPLSPSSTGPLMPHDHSAATRDWGPAALTPAKQTALDWIKAHAAWLSDRHTEVWSFHEPAWRGNRSAAWYVKLLREQGFEGEEGTATMPTAFRATYGK